LAAQIDYLAAHNQLFESMKNKPVLLLLHPEADTNYLIHYVSGSCLKGYVIDKPKGHFASHQSDIMVWPTLLKCLQYLSKQNQSFWPLIPFPLQPEYESDVAHFAFIMQLENPEVSLPQHWTK
jgi:hypothetical protein